jgi:hypothetical protein
MSSLTRGIQNPISQELCKEAETDSRAEFSKESEAGYAGRPKLATYYSAQANSSVLRMLRLCSGSAQALLRLCSGLLKPCSPCSPSAQVKAAAAHVRRLKRKQRKGKLILSLWVFDVRHLDWALAGYTVSLLFHLQGITILVIEMLLHPEIQLSKLCIFRSDNVYDYIKYLFARRSGKKRQFCRKQPHHKTRTGCKTCK